MCSLLSTSWHRLFRLNYTLSLRIINDQSCVDLRLSYYALRPRLSKGLTRLLADKASRSRISRPTTYREPGTRTSSLQAILVFSLIILTLARLIPLVFWIFRSPSKLSHGYMTKLNSSSTGFVIVKKEMKAWYRRGKFRTCWVTLKLQ